MADIDREEDFLVSWHLFQSASTCALRDWGVSDANEVIAM